MLMCFIAEQSLGITSPWFVLVKLRKVCICWHALKLHVYLNSSVVFYLLDIVCASHKTEYLRSRIGLFFKHNVKYITTEYFKLNCLHDF